MKEMKEAQAEGGARRGRTAIRWYFTVVSAGVLVGSAMGCSTFEVEGLRADGSAQWRVSERGAPLLNRTANFTVRHQWLDEETNALHECLVERNTDENAQPQVEALRLLSETVAALAGEGPAHATQTPTH